MPLTQQQEDDEYESRMEQMNANIAQMRANEETLRSDAKYENKTFTVQALVAVAAIAGASAALGNYFAPRTSAAPTIIVNLPPYPTQVPVPAPATPVR